MKPVVSIVLGFRNRDLARVRRCLDSLAAQTFGDFEVLFVDYGSRPPVAREAARLVADHPHARYLYSETRGYPWNRSQALNIGIRQSSGKYIMTTDVDMIFSAAFLQTVAERCGEDRILYVCPHYLPAGFDDWDQLERYTSRLERAPRSAYGGCQTAPAEALRDLQGFDEYYQHWGVEDRDINRRLRAWGLREQWLDDEARIFHQWHPTADVKTPGFLPAGLWGRMETHFQQRRHQLVRNDGDWGHRLTAEDRPVFAWLRDDGGLRRGAGLERLRHNPYDPRSVGHLVRRFWDLEPGTALAVEGAGLPRRRRWLDRGLGAANRLLRATGTGAELGYRFNALHTFLAELVHHRPATLADYYLNVPETETSLLVRGAVR